MTILLLCNVFGFGIYDEGRCQTCWSKAPTTYRGIYGRNWCHGQLWSSPGWTEPSWGQRYHIEWACIKWVWRTENNVPTSWLAHLSTAVLGYTDSSRSLWPLWYSSREWGRLARDPSTGTWKPEHKLEIPFPGRILLRLAWAMERELLYRYLAKHKNFVLPWYET